MQAGINYAEGRHLAAFELVVSAIPWARKHQLDGALAFYSILAGKTHDNAAALLQETVDNYNPSANDNDLSRIGGVFRGTRAKKLQDTADTYLELGDFNNVEITATEAIQLYEHGPAEDRAYGSESMARISLANARLSRNDIDGTYDALQPVLALPSEHRLDLTVTRLKELNSHLRIHSAGKSATGLEIRDSIESFAENTAAHSLPSSS